MQRHCDRSSGAAVIWMLERNRAIASICSQIAAVEDNSIVEDNSTTEALWLENLDASVGNEPRNSNLCTKPLRNRFLCLDAGASASSAQPSVEPA